MRAFIILFLFTLCSCNSLPKERFSLFEWKPQITYSEAGDTISNLQQNGSLVEVGDWVLAGQAIGISGATG